MSHTHTHTDKKGKMSQFLERRRYRQAVALIEPDDIVFDIGCGEGRLRDYLPNQVVYFGMDPKASGKDENIFRGKIGDPIPKRLKSQDVTVITALAVIEHLHEPSLLFKYASKILGPGGRLVITTPHPSGRKVHDSGAKVGLFSSHASEEHETFLDEKSLKKAAGKGDFNMKNYKRFLGGMNQVTVFVKS